MRFVWVFNIIFRFHFEKLSNVSLYLIAALTLMLIVSTIVACFLHTYKMCMVKTHGRF